MTGGGPLSDKTSMGKIESVVLVGQKSVICYIKMVVVALLSVYLVESFDIVSVDLVVNCIVKITEVPLVQSTYIHNCYKLS